MRKSYRLVLDLQRRLRSAQQPAGGTAELLRAAAEIGQETPHAREAGDRLHTLAQALEDDQADGTNPGLEWLCERAVAAIEALCGIAPADWDLLPPHHAPPSDEPLHALPPPEPSPTQLDEISIYLEALRSPFNIGSISRSAAAFGCRRLYLSPDCADERHPRSRRAAMGALEMLEITRISLTELRALKPEAEVVALETGGTPVAEFEFPRCGILVLGNEELGIDPTTLAAPDVHRVSIPCYGAKATLNVGVAAGIALSWWRAM